MSSFTLAWHFLIFGVLPYVVIVVLVLGSLARFVLAPYSWKSQSTNPNCHSTPMEVYRSFISAFRV